MNNEVNTNIGIKPDILKTKFGENLDVLFKQGKFSKIIDTLNGPLNNTSELWLLFDSYIFKGETNIAENLLTNNKNLVKTDYDKVKLILYECKLLRLKGKYSEALDLARVGKERYKKISSDKNLLAEFDNIISLCFRYQGEYSKGLDILFESYNNKEQLDPFIHSKITGAIGVLYFHLGDHNKLMEFLNESIKICKENNFIHTLANNYSLLGAYHQQQGEYELSIHNYEKSRKIFVFLSDKRNIILGDINLANCFNELGNPSKSLVFYEEALKELEFYNEDYFKYLVFQNIGRLHEKEGKIKVALESYYKALELIEKTKNYQILRETLWSIGNIKKIQGDLIEALKYLTLSLEGQNDNPSFLAKVSKNIGNIYFLTADYKLAEEEFLNSFKQYEKINNKKYKTMIIFELARLYKNTDQLDSKMPFLQKLLTENKSKESEVYYNLVSSVFMNSNKLFSEEEALLEKLASNLELEIEYRLYCQERLLSLSIMQSNIDSNRETPRKDKETLNSLLPMRLIGLEAYCLKENLFLELCSVYLLQAKLNYLENDSEKYDSYLKKFKEIIKKNNLFYYDYILKNDLNKEIEDLPDFFNFKYINGNFSSDSEYFSAYFLKIKRFIMSMGKND